MTRALICFVLISLLILGGCSRKDTGAETSQIIESTQHMTVTESSGTTDGQADNTLSDTAQEQDTITSENDTSDGNSEILVVYFSRVGEQYDVGVIDKGNTAIVAEMIAHQTGGDMFEILPQEDYYPYTYDELTDIAKKELRDNARPAYAGEVPDLSRYSTIFIGAPVWWGDWPMICYTFFEENADDLAGKTLVPFSTHAGSGLSGFDKKLAKACPDSVVGTGLAIKGADAQNDKVSVKQSVKDWISGLGY